ncbi:hypothetical protein VP01_3207g1 [Puccinia sorghi]|uniref:Uncharacterized protein n=1 Tax=Puccinia sorghi TaxID=27349 RepID=A0A0L6UYD8_9BASI|nr:hypothetical protein VP01_3207g1 [Puccinia sorghi]
MRNLNSHCKKTLFKCLKLTCRISGKLLLLLQTFCKMTVPKHLCMQTGGVWITDWLEHAASQLQTGEQVVFAVIIFQQRLEDSSFNWENVLVATSVNDGMKNNSGNGFKNKIKGGTLLRVHFHVQSMVATLAFLWWILTTFHCYDLVTPSRTCQGFPQLGDYLQPPHLCKFPTPFHNSVSILLSTSLEPSRADMFFLLTAVFQHFFLRLRAAKCNLSPFSPQVNIFQRCNYFVPDSMSEHRTSQFLTYLYNLVTGNIFPPPFVHCALVSHLTFFHHPCYLSITPFTSNFFPTDSQQQLFSPHVLCTTGLCFPFPSSCNMGTKPESFSTSQLLCLSSRHVGQFFSATIGFPGFGLEVEAQKQLPIGVELAAFPELLLFLDVIDCWCLCGIDQRICFCQDFSCFLSHTHEAMPQTGNKKVYSNIESQSMIYFANIFTILFHDMVHGLYNYICFQDVEDKLRARDPFTIRINTAEKN